MQGAESNRQLQLMRLSSYHYSTRQKWWPRPVPPRRFALIKRVFSLIELHGQIWSRRLDSHQRRSRGSSRLQRGAFGCCSPCRPEGARMAHPSLRSGRRHLRAAALRRPRLEKWCPGAVTLRVIQFGRLACIYKHLRGRKWWRRRALLPHEAACKAGAVLSWLRPRKWMRVSDFHRCRAVLRTVR